eukprot:TRINITY_DN3367_c1_g2_i1.p1 TRINITY_DN3367_c1_g2~~TRINITY_DN3367_c1_g2_i1.p1  ORF type:complete len:321 (+),score=41.00 TRINITY_DN3367_c1_g2_i1:38-964(+)
MLTFECRPVQASQVTRHDPYTKMRRFGGEVDSLIQNKDTMKVATKHLKDLMECMSSGKLIEYCEAWMAPEVSMFSEGGGNDFQLNGRAEFLEIYNKVLPRYGNSKLTAEVDTIKKIGDLAVETEFWLRVTGELDFSERLHEVARFDSSFRLVSCHSNCLSLIMNPPLPLSNTNNIGLINPIKPSLLKLKCDVPVGKRAKKKASKKAVKDGIKSPRYDRPCLHNLWDNVRSKRGVALLRCRTCVSQWKIPVTEFTRCMKFLSEEGCHLGTLCKNLHVHARKLCYEERAINEQLESAKNNSQEEDERESQ